MPRLLIDRPKRRQRPPCGRIIEYHPPHSPFQKLIETQRVRYGFSTRELADRVGTSHSTIWIWLHNENGYPHPKAFKPDHLKLLSKTLHIPQNKIKEAIDASRHLYAPKEQMSPAPAIDAFDSLISILSHDKRQSIKRTWVLNLARKLRAGSSSRNNGQ